MRPDVLAFDEISAPEDIEAIRIAAGCSVSATGNGARRALRRCGTGRCTVRTAGRAHIFRRAVCITRGSGKRVYTVEDLT